MREPKQELLTALNLPDLCRMCRVERTVILALVDFGILAPQGAFEEEWVFDQKGIQRAVRACRLERDLGLNTAGIALVLDLLEERSALLRQLQVFSIPGD